MTFIQEFNQFMSLYISIEIWNYIEIISSVLVFYGCILQRVHKISFKSNTENFFAAKIGQLGLYGQMMMAIFSMVDGYYNMTYGVAHVMLALWALSSAMIKYIAYNSSKIDIS